jgi:ABC-type phosphate transport system substrate-binding protein
MMKHRISTVLFLFYVCIITTITTTTIVTAQLICGPSPSTFTIAGSSTVEPIAQLWAASYMGKCPGITINVVVGGNSSTGAQRVCNVTMVNNVTIGPAVEIGSMSRNWISFSEANVTDAMNKKFRCNIGTKTRQATQIDVANDALVVAIIRGGVGRQNCTDQLPGKGLTIDQLRWMFSNYTTAQLVASGWNKALALPNDDNNETSHNWSELTPFPFCPKVEIKLASPGSLSEIFSLFKDIVLPNATEGLANRRPYGTFTSEKDEDLIERIEFSSEEMYGDMVGYFGYSF